ncbi:MAG: hypothetical protein ABI811_15030 [Acidobacteriota bacterium]
MKTKYFSVIAVLAAANFLGVTFLAGQGTITGVIRAGDKARIAVPDFRGKGAAQPLMNVVNETLWNDLEDAGALTLVTKSNYPLEVPQSAADLKPPSAAGARMGPWLTDWSQPPVSTEYLAIGNADVNASGLLLQGWLMDAGKADVRTAQLFNLPYFGTPNEEGARSVAHQFAADILKNLGIPTMAGSKIYFVSDRTGSTEIWSMDHDGGNQARMTKENAITKMGAVSADGKLVAYVTMVKNTGWQIRVIATATGRQQTFVNPVTSTITAPDFSPDGKQLWFSMTLSDYAQIVVANVNGGQLKRVSSVRTIETSPRVNPKTGGEILFISGRTGHPQLYKMKADGTGAESITNGEGEVANPAWSPDGRFVAFAWNRGFDPGNFNIFVMDVATKNMIQLTHGNGTNESPTWAPDGLHIVFSNQKGRSTQIYTMLANGTRVKQITSAGNNLQPVWTVGMTN